MKIVFLINYMQNFIKNFITLDFKLAIPLLNILLVACVNINKSNQTSTQTNIPNSTITNISTPFSPSKMVKNLAIIEGVENNREKIALIDSLLTQLDEKYPENSEQIGDMTAAAYGEITKKGDSVSIISIMEAMIKVAGDKSEITYAQAVSSYALLRIDGMK